MDIYNNTIEINGKKCFIFTLGINKRDSELHKLINLKSSPGYIVNESKIDKWFFKGTGEKDGVYFYGDEIKGRSLNEIINLPIKDSFFYLKTLIKSINILAQNGLSDFSIQLDSVFFLEDGSILFLPSVITKLAMEIRDDNYKGLVNTVINNPYIHDDNNRHSYTMSALSYRILTGRFPFEGMIEPEILSKVRNQKLIPAIALNKNTPKSINQFFDKVFSDRKKLPEVGEWLEISESWSKELENINIAKSENIEELIKKNDEIFKRKYFFEKNQKIIFTGTIIFIAAILVITYITYSVTKPKVTKGFTSEQVVKTFYESLNKLDHDTASQCVEKKIGNNYINEMTTLYVITKQIEAYTMKSSFRSAENWVKDDVETKKNFKYVYGAANLKIEQIESGETSVYIVSFDKYQPFSTENTEGNDNIKGDIKIYHYLINDKVYVHLKNKYQIIYKIENLKHENVTE